jgi:D-sedoheptulose 7-phosphate isomerase
MNTLGDLLSQSKDFKTFAKGYGRYIARLLEELDVDSLERIVQGLGAARQNGNNVFVIGNGGSAATASHIANDFSFGSRVKNNRSFRVISLTDNSSVLTATANDLGFEQVYLRQLEVYFKPGDKLLVISASGNSPNLVVAAQWVKTQGGQVFGFLGFDGGKLKDICDASVVVKTSKGEYGPVEDIHMILDHLLTCWFSSGEA